MQSSLISKIEKAKRYAAEPERITISNFTADFKGENDDHIISYEAGKWYCNCRYFSQTGICSHTMALQQLLTNLLPQEASRSSSADFTV